MRDAIRQEVGVSVPSLIYLPWKESARHGKRRNRWAEWFSHFEFSPIDVSLQETT